MLRNLSNLQIILGALGLFVAVCFVVGALDPRGPKTEGAAMAQRAQFQLAASAALKLRETLRDPNSLEISSAVVTSEKSVCFAYRAKNGFGGMEFQHALEVDGSLANESDAGFYDLWRARCAHHPGTDFAGEIDAALQ